MRPPLDEARLPAARNSPLDPWYRPSGSLFPPVVWEGRRPDCMAGEQPQAGGSLNPRGLGSTGRRPGMVIIQGVGEGTPPTV